MISEKAKEPTPERTKRDDTEYEDILIADSVNKTSSTTTTTRPTTISAITTTTTIPATTSKEQPRPKREWYFDYGFYFAISAFILMIVRLFLMVKCHCKIEDDADHIELKSSKLRESESP